MNKTIILGVSLLIFAVIMGSQLASSADRETIPLSVSIANNPPEIHAITCNPDPVTLNASGLYDWTIVVCTAEVYDENGYQDITTQGDMNASMMVNLSQSLAACDTDDPTTRDNSTCYHNYSCTYSGQGVPDGNYFTVECSFKLYWYAEATSDEGNFSAWFVAKDSSGNHDWNYTNVTISDLLAINVTDAVNWGAQAFGSVVEQPVEINNTGNVRFDVQLNATNMTCTGGGSENITPWDIAYNGTVNSCGDGGGDFTACCNITNGIPGDECPEFNTNFDLAEYAWGHGGGPNGTVTYLTVKIPVGVSGSCTGWATYIAVKG